MAIAGEEGGEGNAEDGVRRVGFAIERPRSPPLDCEPTTTPLDPDISGEVDPDLGAAAVADPHHRVEEAEPLDKPDALAFGLAVEIRPDAHAVCMGLENDRGGQRLDPTSPQPHGARITRARGHA